MTRRTIADWGWRQFAILWLTTAVIVVILAVVADLMERDWKDSWSFAFTVIGLVQARAVIWTSRWLAVVKPHARWHWGKLLLLWLALLAMLRISYEQTEYDWTIVSVFGGAAGLVVCLALTWTWLSAREQA
jgi:hypothetical protein